MATTIIETPPLTERRVAERRHSAGTASTWMGNALRVSWAGIWAGVLAALGSLLLLTALGVAVGVSAAGNADAGTLGTGAAVWAGLSLLIAMFVGGMVSTRLAMITDRSTGLYEGALVWVLATVLILYLAGSGVGALASGAFSLMGGAGRGVANLAGITDVDLSQQSIDQMVARLQDPGTAQKISTATGLPVNDVRARLDQTARNVQNARDNPAQAVAEVRRGMSDLMAQAQPRLARAGKTSAWISFIALLLSLGAAVGGAAIGRRRAIVHRAEATPRPAV